MTEFMTEQLVKRRTTPADTAKKAGLIILTILTLVLVPIHTLLSWVFIGMLIVDYFMFKRFKVEFEYIYFNGDLDIDKIMNKESRKRVFSTVLKEVEIVAPTDSPDLRPFSQLKVLDFSSKEPEHKTYEMVTLYKGERVRVIFEPNEKILKDMKSLAPRKIIF